MDESTRNITFDEPSEEIINVKESKPTEEIIKFEDIEESKPKEVVQVDKVEECKRNIAFDEPTEEIIISNLNNEEFSLDDDISKKPEKEKDNSLTEEYFEITEEVIPNDYEGDYEDEISDSLDNNSSKPIVPNDEDYVIYIEDVVEDPTLDDLIDKMDESTRNITLDEPSEEIINVKESKPTEEIIKFEDIEESKPKEVVQVDKIEECKRSIAIDEPTEEIIISNLNNEEFSLDDDISKKPATEKDNSLTEEYFEITEEVIPNDYEGDYEDEISDSLDNNSSKLIDPNDEDYVIYIEDVVEDPTLDDLIDKMDESTRNIKFDEPSEEIINVKESKPTEEIINFEDIEESKPKEVVQEDKVEECKRSIAFDEPTEEIIISNLNNEEFSLDDDISKKPATEKDNSLTEEYFEITEEVIPNDYEGDYEDEISDSLDNNSSKLIDPNDEDYVIYIEDVVEDPTLDDLIDNMDESTRNIKFDESFEEIIKNENIEKLKREKEEQVDNIKESKPENEEQVENIGESEHENKYQVENIEESKPENEDQVENIEEAKRDITFDEPIEDIIKIENIEESKPENEDQVENIEEAKRDITFDEPIEDIIKIENIEESKPENEEQVENIEESKPENEEQVENDEKSNYEKEQVENIEETKRDITFDEPIEDIIKIENIEESKPENEEQVENIEESKPENEDQVEHIEENKRDITFDEPIEDIIRIDNIEESKPENEEQVDNIEVSKPENEEQVENDEKSNYEKEQVENIKESKPENEDQEENIEEAKRDITFDEPIKDIIKIDNIEESKPENEEQVKNIEELKPEKEQIENIEELKPENEDQIEHIEENKRDITFDEPFEDIIKIDNIEESKPENEEQVENNEKSNYEKEQVENIEESKPENENMIKKIHNSYFINLSDDGKLYIGNGNDILLNNIQLRLSDPIERNYKSENEDQVENIEESKPENEDQVEHIEENKRDITFDEPIEDIIKIENIEESKPENEEQVKNIEESKPENEEQVKNIEESKPENEEQVENIEESKPENEDQVEHIEENKRDITFDEPFEDIIKIDNIEESKPENEEQVENNEKSNYEKEQVENIEESKPENENMIKKIHNSYFINLSDDGKLYIGNGNDILLNNIQLRLSDPTERNYKSENEDQVENIEESKPENEDQVEHIEDNKRNITFDEPIEDIIKVDNIEESKPENEEQVENDEKSNYEKEQVENIEESKPEKEDQVENIEETKRDITFYKPIIENIIKIDNIEESKPENEDQAENIKELNSEKEEQIEKIEESKPENEDMIKKIHNSYFINLSDDGKLYISNGNDILLNNIQLRLSDPTERNDKSNVISNLNNKEFGIDDDISKKLETEKDNSLTEEYFEITEEVIPSDYEGDYFDEISNSLNNNSSKSIDPNDEDYVIYIEDVVEDPTLDDLLDKMDESTRNITFDEPSEEIIKDENIQETKPEKEDQMKKISNNYYIDSFDDSKLSFGNGNDILLNNIQLRLSDPTERNDESNVISNLNNKEFGLDDDISKKLETEKDNSLTEEYFEITEEVIPSDYEGDYFDEISNSLNNNSSKSIDPNDEDDEISNSLNNNSSKSIDPNDEDYVIYIEDVVEDPTLDDLLDKMDESTRNITFDEPSEEIINVKESKPTEEIIKFEDIEESKPKEVVQVDKVEECKRNIAFDEPTEEIIISNLNNEEFSLDDDISKKPEKEKDNSLTEEYFEITEEVIPNDYEGDYEDEISDSLDNNSSKPIVPNDEDYVIYIEDVVEDPTLDDLLDKMDESTRNITFDEPSEEIIKDENIQETKPEKEDQMKKISNNYYIDSFDDSKLSFGNDSDIILNKMSLCITDQNKRNDISVALSEEPKLKTAKQNVKKLDSNKNKEAQNNYYLNISDDGRLSFGGIDLLINFWPLRLANSNENLKEKEDSVKTSQSKITTEESKEVSVKANKPNIVTEKLKGEEITIKTTESEVNEEIKKEKVSVKITEPEVITKEIKEEIPIETNEPEVIVEGLKEVPAKAVELKQSTKEPKEVVITNTELGINTKELKEVPTKTSEPEMIVENPKEKEVSIKSPESEIITVATKNNGAQVEASFISHVEASLIAEISRLHCPLEESVISPIEITNNEDVLYEGPSILEPSVQIPKDIAKSKIETAPIVIENSKVTDSKNSKKKFIKKKIISKTITTRNNKESNEQSYISNIFSDPQKSVIVKEFTPVRTETIEITRNPINRKKKYHKKTVISKKITTNIIKTPELVSKEKVNKWTKLIPSVVEIIVNQATINDDISETEKQNDMKKIMNEYNSINKNEEPVSIEEPKFTFEEKSNKWKELIPNVIKTIVNQVKVSNDENNRKNDLDKLMKEYSLINNNEESSTKNIQLLNNNDLKKFIPNALEINTGDLPIINENVDINEEIEENKKQSNGSNPENISLENENQLKNLVPIALEIIASHIPKALEMIVNKTKEESNNVANNKLVSNDNEQNDENDIEKSIVKEISIEYENKLRNLIPTALEMITGKIPNALEILINETKENKEKKSNEKSNEENIENSIIEDISIEYENHLKDLIPTAIEMIIGEVPSELETIVYQNSIGEDKDDITEFIPKDILIEDDNLIPTSKIEVNKMNEKISNLENSLTNVRNENKKLQEYIIDIKNENEELRNKLENYSNIKNENELLKNELETYTNVRNENKKLQEYIIDIKNENEELRNKLENYSNIKNENELLKNELETYKTELKKNSRCKTEKIAKLNDDIKKLKKSISIMNQLKKNIETGNINDMKLLNNQLLKQKEKIIQLQNIKPLPPEVTNDDLYRINNKIDNLKNVLGQINSNKINNREISDKLMSIAIDEKENEKIKKLKNKLEKSNYCINELKEKTKQLERKSQLSNNQEKQVLENLNNNNDNQIDIDETNDDNKNKLINKFETDINSFVDVKDDSSNSDRLDIDSFINAKDDLSNTNELDVDLFVDAKDELNNITILNMNNIGDFKGEPPELEFNNRDIYIEEINKFKEENQKLIEELDKLKDIVSFEKKKQNHISEEKKSLEDQIKKLENVIEKYTYKFKKSEDTIQELSNDNIDLNKKIKAIAESYETLKILYEKQKAKNQNDILTKEIIRDLNREKQSDRKRCVPFTENKRRRMELAKRLNKENNNLKNKPNKLITIKSKKRKMNPLESSIQKEINLIPEIKPISFIGHIYNLLGYTVTTTSVLLSLLYTRDYLNAQRFVDKNKITYINENKEVPTPGQLVSGKLTNTLVSSIALLFLLNILYCKSRKSEEIKKESSEKMNEIDQSNLNFKKQSSANSKIEVIGESSFITEPNKNNENHTEFNDKSISILKINENNNNLLNKQYFLPEEQLDEVKQSLESIKHEVDNEDQLKMENKNKELRNNKLSLEGDKPIIKPHSLIDMVEHEENSNWFKEY